MTLASLSVLEIVILIIMGLGLCGYITFLVVKTVKHRRKKQNTEETDDEE